jgi:hypothetical protein
MVGSLGELVRINAGILVILLAFVVALFEVISLFDEKRKKLWHVMILLCAVFILLAGIKAQNDQDEFQRRLIEKNEEIARGSQELAKKSEEIAKKSDKIADLTSEIAFISTGGDSFCFVRFHFLVGAPKTPTLVVFHKGKYPLQNVQIIITDYEALLNAIPDLPKGKSKARAATLSDMEKFEANRTYVDIRTLSPGSGTRVGPVWKLPERDEITYSIQINSLFQTFFQHLKLRRVKGTWQQAFRVHKYGPKQSVIVLLEEVPKGFPVDESGKVKWEYY